MPDTAVMNMPSPDDLFRERMRIPDSLMRHVHFDAITPLGTEYPKTPLFAMAAGRDFGAASSWPFGKAVVGLQGADPCQAPASVLRTPPIEKEPLKELERLGMVANCKQPSSPEDDLNDRLRRAATFLDEQDQDDLLDLEGRLAEIEELLENASQEEQVDRGLVNRVKIMVATTRDRIAGEDPMQLDSGPGQGQDEQGAHEKVEISLPIRINIGELRTESREAAAGGSERSQAPGGKFGRSHGGHVAGGSGTPNGSGGVAGGTGGTGGGNGNDGHWNRPSPDIIHRADEDDEDDEDGKEPQIELADINPPWNEKWYPTQRASFEDGETLFAQNI